jgi:pimeloyl-ACP methyl ester carboxylesterase
MGFLTTDSLGLHCLLSDRLHAPGCVPLLLLHGAGGSGRHWRWLLPELPSWVAPIVFDLPGHGASPGAVPDSVDAAVERIAAVLAGVALNGPVAVAGHSVGGLLALQFALSTACPVSHLGLVATAAAIRPHPELLQQMAGAGVGDRFVRGAFSASVPEERLRVVAEDFGRTRLRPGALDFMDVTTRDLHDRLGSLAIPALVVIARGDPVISPRRSRALAAALPLARVATLEGGHYLHVERPREVAAELTVLLSARSGRPAATGLGNGGSQ